MSRSRRKTPITGITTARSDKADKKLDHRGERAEVRDALAHEQDPPKHPRGRYFSKDGKARFDPKARPELLRK